MCLRYDFGNTGDDLVVRSTYSSPVAVHDLTDKKRNTADKEQQLVVPDANGTIAWLVGERPAAPFCVKESTKEVIHLIWIKQR